MKRLIYLISFLLVFTFDQKTVAQDVPGSNAAADDSLQFHLQKAQTLVKQGKTEEASSILTDIMATHSYNKEAVQWWLIANMKRSPTGEVEAISLLDSLAIIYPSNNALLFWKIFIQAEHGMNNEALENVEKLLKVQPGDNECWIAQGQILQALGRFTEASASFERAIELNPSRTDVYGMRATSLARAGQLPEALAATNKAIDLAPGSPENYYNRACIYSISGDSNNALIDLKKALQMNPEFKTYAVSDPDLKALYDLEEFKALTK